MNIKGEKPSRRKLIQQFKVESSAKEFFSKITDPKFLTVLSIIIAGIFGYITIRASNPVYGYDLSEEILNKNTTESLFPIGEAEIEIDEKFVDLELGSWGSEGPLNGKSYGNYEFWIMNEHSRSISIKEIQVTGPIEIVAIYFEGTLSEVPKPIYKNLSIESKIVSPEDRIVKAGNRGKIKVLFEIDHRLENLREYLENSNPSNFGIKGEKVKITVLYRITGSDVQQKIGRLNKSFNYIFPSEHYEK